VSLNWSERFKNALPNVAAFEFEALRRAGCDPFCLAVALWAGRHLPFIGETWTDVMGSKAKQESSIQTLLDAANLIDRIKRGFLIETADEMRLAEVADPSVRHVTRPSAVSDSLRQYAKLIEKLPVWARTAEIKAEHDLPRYVVTAYVHIATGTWNDSLTSAVIDAAYHPDANYDEQAQKQWRHRNFERLDAKWKVLPLLLSQVADAMHSG
jgi:hypothetical protein